MTTPILTYKPNTNGVTVDLDRLIASRMLVQANSGGGKSRALRQMLEETFGRVQHLVIDPEGEFSTLREKFDYILAAKHGGDTLASPKTAKVLCRRLVELGASAILDLYELPLHERREFVMIFLTELMSLPRPLWRPILVVIDEIHVFAPESGSGESQSTESVIALATQGRKRGFSLVGATQRISKLKKDAAAELLNKMIGRTGLDVDVKRAGDELGLDKEARNGLKRLSPGEFFVYGPAIANEVQLIRTGTVKTTHPEAGRIGDVAPPASANVRAMLSKLADLPQEAEREARTIADLERANQQLRSDLTRAQRNGATTERVVEKPVVDERAIKRAVADAVRPFQTKLRDVERYLTPMHRLIGALGDQYDGLQKAIGAEIAMQSLPAVAPIERPSVATQRTAPAPGDRVVADGVTAPQQRILDALAGFESLGIKSANKSIVAVFADQSPTSSGFANNLGRLRSTGLIDYPSGGVVALTATGRAGATGMDIRSLDELHSAWEKQLPAPQWKIVKALIGEHPETMERDTLAYDADQSATSSGYANNIGRLRSLGLIEYSKGDNGTRIGATDLLFPEGLR